MFKTILVAFDGSDHAKKALAFAADIAAKYKARIVLLHALLRDAPPETIRKLANARALTKAQRELLDTYEIEPQLAAATTGMGGAFVPIPAPRELLEPIGRQILDRAEAVAKKAGVTKISRVMVSGDAGDAVLEEAKKQKADMIVMGSRGFGDLKSLLLGSVSHKVAARAPCSVVTVK